MTYLTPQQVAERLQMHPAVIRRKCASGEIEAVKPGGWRISEDALHAWLHGPKPLKPSRGEAKVADNAPNFRRGLQAIQSNTEAAA